MKHILFFLLFCASSNSYSQFNIDLGVILSTSKSNRYQIENRYHFGNHLTFLMNVGGNRWHNKLPITYRTVGDSYSSQVYSHFATDYLQLKLGLQRNVFKNEELKLFIGAKGGVNLYTAKQYEVICQLSFDYDPSSEEFYLIYAYPKSLRKMKLVESQHQRQYVGELFAGIDYRPFFDLPIVFTGDILGAVRYQYQTPFELNTPFSFIIEVNCGVRYLLRDN